MEPPPPHPSDTARSARRVRGFKLLIVLATVGISAALIASSAVARFKIERGVSWVREEIPRLAFGLEPDRSQVEADWERRRAYSIDRTREVLERFYRNAPEEMKELFRVAGMDPDHGLIRYGRGDPTFLISSQVFEADDHGRSYRMRPNTRSVWLRQITLHDGPFGMFQVLDTPEHRAAAARAGAIVDEHSVQNTNSWGLRGPEPDPAAPIRGVVLGDSFMQAMFNGDDETPSVYLARRLEGRLEKPVSIANTGHIGYSPEQYYYSLVEYGERLRPQFVVVSVCPNDFGDDFPVLAGKGDGYDEAAYWLEQIQRWCFNHKAVLLMVAVPTYFQINQPRKEAFYPGQACNIFEAGAAEYCDPTETFIDEDLRLRRDALRAGEFYGKSRLYNLEIADNHFSPRGADLWAEVVARRLTLRMEVNDVAASPKPPTQGSAGAVPDPIAEPSH